jgi:hypothetical protein
VTATVTMTARASLIAAALCAAVTAPQPALADETRRLAVIIGNNRGTGARPPLRYAEDDAEELARVLRELGGFKSGDVVLLRGGSLADVERAMAAVGSTLAVARAQGQRAVLLFYFSGHSDGEALEVGVERWSFADVRRKLKEQAADIRLVIVDSCRSGALLAAKGGTPGPAFDIRFTDDLATSGEAVLTSSAPHEVALESREIRASFFSHHLISGLRGAADSSGDGRVTLGEAYRYAFVNTLLSTSNTLTGPQHPAYDYRLAGRGELVLTDVTVSGARLTLPAELSRVLIVDGGRRRLVAELTDLSIRRIALPGGRYIIQGQREGRAYEMVVVLANGEARRLALSEFKPSVGSPVSSKGD